LLYLFLLLAVAGALLFMRLPIVPTYAGRTIENAGHMPLFCLITLGVLLVFRDWHPFRSGRFPRASLYVFAGLAGVCAGFLSEVIQKPLRRDASWEDVFADTVGVVFALAAYFFFDRRVDARRWQRGIAAVVMIVCATIYLAPIVTMTRAYLHRNGQFPVLADFRSPLEMYWTVSIGVRREIVDGALQVEFVADDFPGLSFHEPVADWRGYRALLIDVENPSSDALELGVRVHEIGHGRQYSDRFNRRFTLEGGERKVLRIELEDIRTAPRNRPMNMQRVSDITLFRTRKGAAREIRLYGMRLE
jgi:hypothetical protein